jgi:hypothetical protein
MAQKIKVQDGILSYSAADPTELIHAKFSGNVGVTNELRVGADNPTSGLLPGAVIHGTISPIDGTATNPARLDITAGPFGSVNIYQTTGANTSLNFNNVQWPVGTVPAVRGTFVGCIDTNKLEYISFFLNPNHTDGLARAALNSMYPGALAGQMALGGTVIYLCVVDNITGSGEWRIINALAA